MRCLKGIIAILQTKNPIPFVLTEILRWGHEKQKIYWLCAQGPAQLYNVPEEVPVVRLDTSLNQIDHIMTFHDMSSNVTMLNWKTFHDIWWHLDGSTPSDIWWQMGTFGDISWHFMTFGLEIKLFIMICHDMSWYDPLWFREVVSNGLCGHKIQSLWTSFKVFYSWA